MASLFHNCIREPILPPAMAFTNIVPMPLHMSLGVCETYLNAARRYCVHIDSHFAAEKRVIQSVQYHQLVRVANNEYNNEHVITNIPPDQLMASSIKTINETNDNLMNELIKSKGATIGLCESRLNQFISDIKVKKKGGMGSQLVGDEVQRVLDADNRARLVNIIAGYTVTFRDESTQRFGSDTEAIGFGYLLDVFESIYAAVMSVRSFDEARLQQLCNDIEIMANVYPRIFHFQSITPKLHVLMTHMLPFATQHNTIGMMSEQSMEATHQSFKACDRQFQAITGRGRVLELSMRQHTIRTDALSALPREKRSRTDQTSERRKRRRLVLNNDE